MLSFLALGFLVGLRHALEPDHVAAVFSLSTRGGTLRQQALGGALWGLGHALTLLLLAGTCVALGLAVPEELGRLLEAAVGVMLIALGASVFLRLRRERVHVHRHVHADGTVHWHAHAHPVAEGPHDASLHEHAHAGRARAPGSLRTLLVGAVHGLAGSAALVLLVGGAARTPALGIAYVALFGLGASVGMMALAATLSVPLDLSARWRAGAHRAVCAAAGLASAALGAYLVLDQIA